MNNFSIKDVERLSGIKAHTLRIWEQRHGLRFCKRRESLHRYYDNEDLKKILRISYLYHNGYKISKIATLSEEEIKNLATTHLAGDNYNIYINQMIESSMDYDQPRFEKIVHNALLHLGLEKTIMKVFYPFMEKIGLLWIAEHVIPAQEHFSTFLIQKKLILAIDGMDASPPHGDANVIVFSPMGEMHEIPLLLAQYQLKKNKIRTVYFGVNTPISDLEYYCGHKPVSHLFLHLIANFLNKEPEEYINCIHEKFPDKKIIASGPAFASVQEAGPHIRILRSVNEMMEINKLIR